MEVNPNVTLLKDEGAYRVAAAAALLDRAGRKVIHLEIGQPSFKTPEYIANAAKDAITSGFTQYVNPSGLPELKEEIAKHVNRTRNIQVEAANVVVGPGAKPPMYFAMQCIMEPGCEVLIPDPGFPSYENTVKVFGGVAVRFNALNSDTAGEIEKLITPKTRLIILNSPSNPTGRVFSQKENEQIAAVLKKHSKIYVISDEIYCHLFYNNNSGQDDSLRKEFPTCHSIASIPGMLERTIIVDGFSKTFSMTGFRLGFAVAEKSLAARLHLLLTHAIGCTASFTQKAGVVALSGENRVKEVMFMVNEYKKRRDYVVSRLNSIPGIKCDSPEGAFYAFADVSGIGIPTREFCDKCLNEGLVAILPGGDFGAAGENFIRISYVGSEDVLKEGLDRIAATVEKIKAASSPNKKVKV